MLAYWPFGVGIGIFIGLVFIIVKLVRRKREGDGADLLEREEESGSVEDSGSRGWREGVNPSVVVPTLISVAAILIALFSGPSQKDIIASVKSSVRANFENRFSDFQSQLDKKANDSSVGQLKSDLGKVKEDGEANTASLGLLSGRADASDQKMGVLHRRFENFQNKEYYQDKGILNSRIKSLEWAKASQDSINAQQKLLNSRLAEADHLNLTPEQFKALDRVLARADSVATIAP